MLRSVILMAGFILLAVLFLAPSLPSAPGPSAVATDSNGEQVDDPAARPSPDTVERLFASSDEPYVAQPDRSRARQSEDDSLVSLPAPGSSAAQDGRAPEY